MGVEYYDVEGHQPKKWLRNTIITVVSVIALFVSWRVVNSHRVNQSLAELKAAGYPTTLEELAEKYYPNIPAHDNAATFYKQAFTLLNASNLPSGNWWMYASPPRTGPLWASNEAAKAMQTVADNQPMIAALRNILATPGARYPLMFDQFNMKGLGHLNGIYDGARYLGADATLNADAGRIDVALDDLEAELRMAKSLENEPTVRSQLARQRIRMMVYFCTERMLNEAVLSDEQLSRLSKAFEANYKFAPFERGLAEELCQGARFFQMPVSEKIAMMNPGSSANTGERFFHGFLAFFGQTDRDHNLFLRCMTERLKISKLPFPERLEVSARLEDGINESLAKGYFLYSAQLLPGWANLNLRDAEDAARQTLVLTALAAERYRLANGGKPPKNLKDLTPSFLPEIPKDPFNGGPLRFRTTNGGYQIYSVGTNRVDDGGKESVKDQRFALEDVTFTVERK